MNRTTKLAMFSLIVCTAPAFATDDGFAGTWVLDKHSPRPGNAPSSMETTIKQKGSSVIILSTFSEPADRTVPLVYLGIMTTKLSLAANGQEQENMIGPFDMQSKTTISGNQMLTQWIATILGDQVEGYWTHTLKDARHLILEIREISTRGQKAEATLYFIRK